METLAKSSFSTWKKVKVGNLNSKAEVLEKLKTKNVGISWHAENLLKRTALEKLESEIDLVRISSEMLGFTQTPSTAEVHAAALLHSVNLCPPEVAVQLCLQHFDALIDEHPFHIAMHPVRCWNGDVRFFSLQHEDRGLCIWAQEHKNRWLGGDWIFVQKE